MKRDFLDLAELSRAELTALLERAGVVRAERGRHARPLAGRTVALLFDKASTRTRVSFEVAVSELGGQPIESGDPLLFDAALAAALRRFQEQRGLVADGVVTDATLLNLQSAIGTAGFEPDAGAR